MTASSLRVLRRVHRRCGASLGHCREKAEHIAEGCHISPRQCRRILGRLEDLGLIATTRRRMRWRERAITDLGLVVLGERSCERSRTKNPHPTPVGADSGSFTRTPAPPVSGQMSAHMSAHNRSYGEPRVNLSAGSIRSAGSAGPCLPHRYRLPKAALSLRPEVWEAVADWLGTARSVSWARCKIAHRAIAGLVAALRRWGGFWAWADRASCESPDRLVLEAIRSAMRSGRDFGTVETATALIRGIVQECVADGRMPR